MKVWELINPSDAITFEAPSLAVAATVTLTVGSGVYGADSEDGEKVPILALGDSEAVEAWVAQEFGGMTVEELFAHAKQAVPAALLSFVTGSRSDRKLFESALAKMFPDKREEYREVWEDAKRTSMNQITEHAHDLGRRMQDKAAKATA